MRADRLLARAPRSASECVVALDAHLNELSGTPAVHQLEVGADNVDEPSIVVSRIAALTEAMFTLATGSSTILPRGIRFNDARTGFDVVASPNISEPILDIAKVARTLGASIADWNI